MLDLEEKCCRGGGRGREFRILFSEGKWANGSEILGGCEKLWEMNKYLQNSILLTFFSFPSQRAVLLLCFNLSPTINISLTNFQIVYIKLVWWLLMVLFFSSYFVIQKDANAKAKPNSLISVLRTSL